MKIEQALKGVKRLFLDTAPVVYFVEQNPEFVIVQINYLSPIPYHLKNVSSR
jgi:hypothetical protein